MAGAHRLSCGNKTQALREIEESFILQLLGELGDAIQPSEFSRTPRVLECGNLSLLGPLCRLVGNTGRVFDSDRVAG